jgi:hypothetical protein
MRLTLMTNVKERSDMAGRLHIIAIARHAANAICSEILRLSK